MIYIMFWPIFIVEIIGIILAGLGWLIEITGRGLNSFGEALVNIGFNWEDRC